MSDTKTITHGSHWGAFTAEVENGRLIGVEPFANDADPSPILASMPESLYADCRVERPMVRKGWLDDGPGGPGSGDGRGAEPFVAVPWDEAS